MTNVAIIDYGMGNLFSVSGAFSEIGTNVKIAKSPCELRGVDHVILPGVGSFKSAMEKITAAGFDEALREAIVRQKKVLGICLGMQLLFSHGQEGGETEGLGFLDGLVSRIKTKNMPVPHVGFNNVTAVEDSILLNGINGADFYFVHSYKMMREKLDCNYSITNYGVNF